MLSHLCYFLLSYSRLSCNITVKGQPPIFYIHSSCHFIITTTSITCISGQQFYLTSCPWRIPSQSYYPQNFMSYVVFGLGSSVRLLTTYLYFQIQSLVQSHNVLHQKISHFFCRCVIGKKQEDVSCVMRRGCVWCIKIYRSVFSLLSQHYRKLVQVLDYRRIIPLLEEWSESMVHNTGCSPDVLFFSNGKPWKVAKPGNGDAADALIRAAGGDQVNLIQQAFTMVIMVLLVPKYSISCKQMGFVTASLVHCIGMMPWYFKNPPCLPCFQYCT